MQIDVSRDDDLYILDITIPKGQVDKAIGDFVEQIKPTLQVKGYRKGQVPTDVIKRMFQKEIRAEVGTRLLQESVSTGLRENQIKNAGNPILLEEYRPTQTRQYVGKYGLDGTVKFKVSVEPPPEIDVTGYTNIEIPDTGNSFDEWVEKELLKQQMIYGDKEEVARAAKVGDEVMISFTGTVDGVEFVNEEDFGFMIGEEIFTAGFTESFAERSPGEEFDIKVTFPEDYGDDDLNGKDAMFAVKLDSVYETVPHPINDDLAMMLSYSSVDEMMQSYRTIWKEEFEKPFRAQIVNALMDTVIENNPFKVPEAWVSNEVRITAQRMQLATMPDNPAMLNSLREIAERTVRTSFLLDKIYEKEEEIHLSSDDIERIIKDEAAKMGMDWTNFMNLLKERGQYEPFIAFHQQQRAVDFLIDNAVKVEEENNE